MTAANITHDCSRTCLIRPTKTSDIELAWRASGATHVRALVWRGRKRRRQGRGGNGSRWAQALWSAAYHHLSPLFLTRGNVRTRPSSKLRPRIQRLATPEVPFAVEYLGTRKSIKQRILWLVRCGPIASKFPRKKCISVFGVLIGGNSHRASRS